MSELLTIFQQRKPFPLDEFQLQAARALDAGESVLVAAPTGSGKTVVAEYGVARAHAQGSRVFYTTPIKALSNQKYRDLVAEYGGSEVGLLTGDQSINADAPIVVMTTEVLRNMLYQSSDAAQRIARLDYVVLDEVHYLADRFRGPVWEEVILHLPPRVQIIALSATVSNASEFGDWLERVHGAVTVVTSTHRPVPLEHHVQVERQILPLLRTRGSRGELNPRLVRAAEQAPYQRRRRSGLQRLQTIDLLDEAGFLPAIVFIFSRAGCDQAAEQLRGVKLSLTTAAQRRQIDDIITERTKGLSPSDRAALGFGPWAQSLRAGIAAHHAGMVPLFKEVVEELFIAGLLKVVFATETLALGVNMPARSVVLEQLDKWDGVAHGPLTAAEYAQLTGRAGRRGIDVEGHAVSVLTPDVDLRSLATLASTTSYPLRSAFHPTYNMVLNLIHTANVERARATLELSFAQFQTDRDVVDLAAEVQGLRRQAESRRETLDCDLGDVVEYLGTAQQISKREKQLASERAQRRTQAAIEQFEGLLPGDIVAVARGRRRGYSVVITSPRLRRGTLEVTVINEQGRQRPLTLADTEDGLTVANRIDMPRRFVPSVATHRRDLASRMASTLGARIKSTPQRPPKPSSKVHHDAELKGLKAALIAHPVHECPEREKHLRDGSSYLKAREAADRLERRLQRRTGSLGQQFDAIRRVLRELGYLVQSDDGEEVVSEAGMLLRRVYAERDLLIAECVRSGAWEGTNAAELAAGIAAVIYEARNDRETPRVPPPLETVVARTERVAARVSRIELAAGKSESTQLNHALVGPIAAWTEGVDLIDVLEGSSLAPGDFVRWSKQVLDVLGQLAGVAPQPGLRQRAGEAMDAIRRGVVALGQV